MIYGDPKKAASELWAHIDHSRQVMARYAESPLKIQRAIHGVHYGFTSDVAHLAGTTRDDPDNHHYEMMTRMLPEMAMRKPRWHIGSRASDVRRDYLLGIKTAMDRWSTTQDSFRDMQRQAVDYLSGWCSSVVTMGSDDFRREPGKRRGRQRIRSRYRDKGMIADIDPRHEARGSWPKHVRKAILDLVWDMEVDRFEDRRWSAHKVRIDRRELLRWAKNDPDGGWDLDAIKNMPTNRSEFDEAYAEVPRDRGTHEAPGVDQWQEMVVFWEMWIPGYRDDEKADRVEAELGRETHGTLFTISMHGDAKTGGVFLREHRPYCGPRTGPHVVSGAYWIGESKVPLSHMVAVERQVQDLNNIARAIRRNAERYKRVLLVDPEAGDTSRYIAATPHDHIVRVPGLMRDGKPAVVPVEIGGITDQMLQWYSLSRERVDRVSGFIDTDAGQAASDVTATVGSLAAAGAAARRGGVIQGWHNHLDEVGVRAAHFLINDEGVAIELDGEAAASIAQELGLDQPGTLPPEVAMDLGVDPATQPAWRPGEPMLFRGGQMDLDVDELALFAEPHSLRYRDENQRALQLEQAVAQLVGLLQPISQTADAVEWRQVLDLLGQSKDIPGFADLVNLEALGASEVGADAKVLPATASSTGTDKSPASITIGANVRGGRGDAGRRAQEPNQQGRAAPQAQSA